MRLRTIRRIAQWALILACAATVAAPALGRPDPYDPHRLMLAKSHFDKGMKLLSETKEEAAEREFTEAVKLFPELVEAHIQLGNLSMRHRNFSQALERYLKARQSLADLQGMRHAQEMERLRRLQENIDLVKERIDDLRASPRASDAGKVQQEMVRLEKLERERTHSQPSAETPFNPQIHFLVGNALMKLERYDEARAELTQALVLRPDFGEAHNNLAVLCFYKREYDECWEHVHSAEAAGVRVDPLFRAELAALAPEPALKAKP